MAGATTTMSIRMDRTVKEQSQQLFKSLGMDMTTAINIFLRQALIKRGLPFEVTAEGADSIMMQRLAEMTSLSNACRPELNFAFGSFSNLSER